MANCVVIGDFFFHCSQEIITFLSFPFFDFSVIGANVDSTERPISNGLLSSTPEHVPRTKEINLSEGWSSTFYK